jgi:hypothetical protein
MKMRKALCAVVSAFLLLLAACSSESSQPAAEKEKAKPAVPVGGRYAFNQMYITARAWAPDLEVLRLSSIPLAEVKSEAGKAGAWQAVFVSAQLSRARTYTYSVVESAGNLHQGVFSSGEESYSGPRGQTKPFLPAAIKVDSDAAYETAAKKAVEYEKKNPNLPITFLLESTKRFPDPAWRVIWGESVGTSNFSVFVDASTGEYLETMR